MSSLLRRCTAEAVGTFALVFIGAGSIMSGFFPKSDFGVLGVALAHGLILATMITATERNHVIGVHFVRTARRLADARVYRRI